MRAMYERSLACLENENLPRVKDGELQGTSGDFEANGSKSILSLHVFI